MMVQLQGKRELIKQILAIIGLATLPGKATADKDSSQHPASTNSEGKKPSSQEEILPPQLANENHIIRMMGDVKRALAKPIHERRWGMAIDLRKCVGCSACTINCAVENGLPPGVIYRPVVEETTGTYPNIGRRFIPRPCMQCEQPPCTPVCPVNATYTRPDGIVEINYEQCIGCKYCITACPYSARTADYGEFFTKGVGIEPDKIEPYEVRDIYEYNAKMNRSEGGSPVGNARKCTFCIHKVEKGILPSCVTTCIGHATYFGDLNDPKSLVSELAVKSNVMKLKEEHGTKPKVFYLT